jgi:type I restriction enzyme, S subunit
MNELPDGWTAISLGEIAAFEMGQAPPGTSCNKDGYGTVFVKAGEFGVEYPIVREWTTDPLKFAKQGDVLICVVGATSGKLNLGIDCAIGRSVAAIRPIPAVNQMVLYRQLQLQVEQLRAASTGSAQGVISKQMLADIRVVVPPAREQARIEGRLDTLLARIQACNDRLDAIPALLKRFRQAVVDAATSGDLIEVDSSPAPMVALRTVLAQPMRNGKSVRDGSGLRVLRLTSLKHSGVDLNETKTGDWSGVSDVQRFLIRNGDYLVSRGNGSKELVGRGGLVANCDSHIAFPDTMIRIRPDTSRLLPDYLHYVWGATVVRRQIENAAKTTAGIWKVSQPDLEGVTIPLPSPEWQAVIVRRVQGLLGLSARIEVRHAAGTRQARRLTPLSLATAFRGELVPQDPNDEPAAALLARLKALEPLAADQRPRRAPKTPSKRPTMSNTDKGAVRAAILELKTDKFSFDELRTKVAGDYESLKAALFELLEEPTPVVKQVFDKKVNAIRLVRVRP